MIWEYLILAVIVAWAVFYLWRMFFQKKGCVCESCPSAKKDGCVAQIMRAHHSPDTSEEEEKKGKAVQ